MEALPREVVAAVLRSVPQKRILRAVCRGWRMLVAPMSDDEDLSPYVVNIPTAIWALNHGVPIAQFRQAMVEYAPLYVLFWFSKRCPTRWNMTYACELAAKHNRLDVLKWLRARGCPWDASVCHVAAEYGHLELLRWSRAQNPPCPWTGHTTLVAAEHGHLHILQWCLSQHPPCPLSFFMFSYTANKGQLHILQWLTASGYLQLGNNDRIMDMAAPRMDMVRWLHSQGSRGTVSICKRAAKDGHLHVLQWLYARGYPLDHEVSDWAIIGGQLHVLQWLHVQKCTFQPNACDRAILHGHLHVLQWLCAQGHVVSERACTRAAAYGFLHVLQWLRAQHPPHPWSLKSCVDEAFYAFLMARICVLKVPIGLPRVRVLRVTQNDNSKYSKTLHWLSTQEP